MNYLPNFYSSIEEAKTIRDAAVNIANELNTCPQKERLIEDIWDLNDYIDSMENGSDNEDESKQTNTEE